MHRMNSVVLPLFAVVLACSACGRSDYGERQAERDRIGVGRGMTHEEPVSQTETTGAKLNEQNVNDADKEKARQDALEEGRKAGMAEAQAACDAEKNKAKGMTEPKKAEPKKAKAKTKDHDETSMTKPIPTPTPPAPPPPSSDMGRNEPVGTTTITSEPMPAPKAEQNESTTLGDSSSGMYTGGKGSYGGTATWGTGPKK